MPGTFESDQFNVTETWTITGGSGSGFIEISFPPFISFTESPEAGDADVDTQFGDDQDGEIGYAHNCCFFTFGVPFSFNSRVYIQADGGGSASIDYDLSTATYQVPFQAFATSSDDWYIPYPNPAANETFVTLERSAALIQPAPEPRMLWACLGALAGLTLRGAFRRRLNDPFSPTPGISQP